MIHVEFIISGVGLISNLLGIYNNFERKSVLQATKLEKLKLKVELWEKEHAEHGKRQNDQEQKKKDLITINQKIKT
ncbi:hypothetical protein ACEE48_10965 [Streptococcus pluranimalium]